jgi:hypothetical protein
MSGKMRWKIALVALVSLLWLVAAVQCGGEETTTPTPPLTTTPTVTYPPLPAMTGYESTEYGFAFDYPEEWTDSTHGGVKSFYIQYQSSEGDFAVNVSLDYRYEPAELAEVVAETKTYLEAMPQYELFSEGDVTTGGGISGYEMIGQGEETGSLQKFRYIILVRDMQAFWVGVFAEPAQFEERRNLVDAIIDSFSLSAYTYEPPPPSPGGTYTSTEYGFSITYPAGWSDVTSGQFAEILDLRADAGVPEVMVRTWIGEGSAQEAAQTLQQVYPDNFPDYELLSEGETTLDDGTPAYQFVFNATMEGYLLTLKCVTLMRGEEVFSLMGFSPVSSFAQDEAVIDAVIGSFHLE